MNKEMHREKGDFKRSRDQDLDTDAAKWDLLIQARKSRASSNFVH